MAKKNKGDNDQLSLFNISQHAPDDFLFTLLRLVNYSGESEQKIPFEKIVKARFRNMDLKSLGTLLFLLSEETGITWSEHDTEISVPKQSAVAIWRIIDVYLKKFHNDKLEPIEENRFNFEKQKRYFLETIKRKLDDGMTENLLLVDSEIDHGYNFFESILLLEREKYLKIVNIYNRENPKEIDYYRILISTSKAKIQALDFEVKTGALKQRPFCVEENGIGYLKLSKNGSKIKISRNTSRPFRLLRYLVEFFGAARKVDEIYRILTGKNTAGADPLLGAGRKITSIEYTKKELQKISGFSDKLTIRIDKERKNVWIERKDLKE